MTDKFDQGALNDLREFFNIPGLAVAFTEDSFESPKILVSGERKVGSGVRIERQDKF